MQPHRNHQHDTPWPLPTILEGATALSLVLAVTSFLAQELIPGMHGSTALAHPDNACAVSGFFAVAALVAGAAWCRLIPSRG